MGTSYRFVRLLKNHIYPTYQLHAFMANRKTAPRDGLRLGALTTLQWLSYRLGEEAPAELSGLPGPEAYREINDDCLTSFHINYGFVVDVVSLPEQGIWTMQITEPDLGSDPGNPEQERQAVPGRIIETNISFRISGTELECGFQTTVSDPVGTVELADVYRLTVARQLLNDENFGLRQESKLSETAETVSTASQLKNILSVWKHDGNHLPCVFFTGLRAGDLEPGMPSYGNLPLSMNTGYFIPWLESKDTGAGPSYDTVTFARRAATFARIYLLEDDLLERFEKNIGEDVTGSIVVLEPVSFGGGVRQLPYKVNKGRREEQISTLQREMYTYLREREISFGNIQFLSAAREGLLQNTESALRQSDEIVQEWLEKMEHQEAVFKVELAAKEDAYRALQEQLERQKEYSFRLVEEKDALRKELTRQEEDFARRLSSRDDELAFYQRKLDQPEEYDQIADWVERHFNGRLLMHQKAITLLEDRSARDIDIHLICDALDFLATDYWESRYNRLPRDEMHTRCSRKYGRPFETKPIGDMTVGFTPSQYKIKYFPGALGKPVESPLDFHLCVGNAPENLLRIYFLHDDEKQLIVIGSLPRHLKAVSVK